MKRPRARTKVTKNGQILGRPSGNAGPGLMIAAPPVVTRRQVGLVWPRPVFLDGICRTAFGPPKPIYEQRENGVGRWGQTTSDDILWIIRAIDGLGRPDYASTLAQQLVEGGERLVVDAAAVKRKLASTRAEIRARSDKLATPRKVPHGISDISPEY